MLGAPQPPGDLPILLPLEVSQGTKRAWHVTGLILRRGPPTAAIPQEHQRPSAAHPTAFTVTSTSPIRASLSLPPHPGFPSRRNYLEQLFGLGLSQGAIAKVIARAAEKLQPQAEALLRQVCSSPVVDSNETGARIANTKGENAFFCANHPSHSGRFTPASPLSP